MSLTINPIGYIRTGYKTKFDSPHQPNYQTDDGQVSNTVELLPGCDFEQALRDLASFDKIWLIWWFNKNTTWGPVVLPPRGPAVSRGVFATRSPHRPNPIGITAATLISISGRSLKIGAVDLLDHTPILDIKPYIATVDSFPDAKLGWVGEIEKLMAEPGKYIVQKTQLAEEQLAWLLENFAIDFFTRAAEILSRDPTVHRTRRIRKFGSEQFQIGCGGWRLVYRVTGYDVIIERVMCGYPEKMLRDSGNQNVPDRDAQIGFLGRW